MSNLIRRFRGFAIALAVLAISAGAVFASAPRFTPVSAPAAEEPTGSPEATETPEPTETPRATETPEPTETPRATETPEPTETPRATATPMPTGSPEATETPEATSSPAADTHGALVSAAAHMRTPAGFANHGAWVSCIAHMKGTLATVNLATVTPASCAAKAGERAHNRSDKAQGPQKGSGKAVIGKMRGHATTNGQSGMRH